MKLFDIIKLNDRIIRGGFIFITIVSLFSINCNSDGAFRVTVYSSEMQPIGGARIAGGFDWDAFSVETDFEGVAILPSHARGQRATISKTNFYPYEVESLEPRYYVIESTPQMMKLIGEINGDLVQAVQFDSDRISAVDYHGNYHVYEYNDNGLNQIASVQLPGCIRYFKVFGNTLWLSTHEQGFYVYSLQNLLQPQIICHIDIPGCNIRPFAVKDTILAVAETEGALRLFSFSYDGQFQEIVGLGDFWVRDVTFISHYLIIVGAETSNRKCFPVVYDLQDPANPQCVYTGSEPEFLFCFMYKNYLVMQSYSYTSVPIDYRLLDLSNPANPHEAGSYPSEAYFIDIINDSTAIGMYSPSVAVLKGGILSGFNIAATVSEGYMLDEFGGSYPPYYIIAHNLWKLED